MDDLLADLNIRHERDVRLGPLTWYGLGGPASILAHPSSIQQLASLAARAHEQGVAVYVLGVGANLLIADEGVDGIVVKLDDPAFRQIHVQNQLICVGSGFDLMKLVLEAARRGLSGLECLAGIPATVGGAARMNAGGAYGDIGKSIKRISVMDASGHVYARDRDDLVFGYRHTNIVARYILEAELELACEDPDAVMKQVKEIFMYKKNSQPLTEHSAGCAFKNPPPEVGSTAGQLIERAGLKGFQVGGAQVSDRHANFIITHSGCTTRDVVALMDHIHRTVRYHQGVELQREVIAWP